MYGLQGGRGKQDRKEPLTGAEDLDQNQEIDKTDVAVPIEIAGAIHNPWADAPITQELQQIEDVDNAVLDDVVALTLIWNAVGVGVL